jgi:acetyl esterase
MLVTSADMHAARPDGLPARDERVIAASFGAILNVRRLSGKVDLEALRREPKAAREGLRRLVGFFRPKPHPDATVMQRPAIGPICVLDIEPAAPIPGRVIYVHGGGFVFHDTETFLPSLTQLSVLSRRRITVLGYPKAPETKPSTIVAALCEAIALLVHAGASRDGVVPVLAGDSVGGLIVLYAGSSRLGDLKPRLAMIYPVLDLTETRQFDSRVRYGSGYLLDSATMAWFRALGRDAFPEDFDPLALRADQWNSLGPIMIVAARCDVLHDEATAFHAAALAAGRNVSLSVVPCMPHDFLLFAGRVPEASTGMGMIARALSA